MLGRISGEGVAVRKAFGVVYEIRCQTSGKSYIGITKRSIKQRWKGHCDNALESPRNRKRFTVLAAAIRKYGKEAFTITEIASAFDETGLLLSERIIIEQNNTVSPNGYNLTAGGQGLLNPSAETRKKKSKLVKQWWAGLTQEQRLENTEKRVAPLRGRKRDPSATAKMVAKQRGTKRKSWGNHSPETRAKMSANIRAAIQARGGQRYSAEYRKRMGQRLIGKKQSPELVAKRMGAIKASRRYRSRSEQQLNLFNV